MASKKQIAAAAALKVQQDKAQLDALVAQHTALQTKIAADQLTADAKTKAAADATSTATDDPGRAAAKTLTDEALAYQAGVDADKATAKTLEDQIAALTPQVDQDKAAADKATQEALEEDKVQTPLTPEQKREADIAKAFADNPKATQVFVASDGNVFVSEQYAKMYAKDFHKTLETVAKP